MLIFEQIRVGGDRNFAYLIGESSSREALLVDPSYSPERVVERAKAQGLNVRYIFNTHSHCDHTNGNQRAQELCDAPICIFGSGDIALYDGQEISVGQMTLQILHVPGHCDDHIALYIVEHSIAITGDHLFVGKIGGTATRESSYQQYMSLKKLYEKLPLHATIWPGHDVGSRPSSTLALERVGNPFLQAETFESFYALKQNWASYKAEHGLI